MEWRKLKGASDTGLLIAVALVVGVLWLGGAFTQLGAVAPVTGGTGLVCPPESLPPGTSTISLTAASKERGAPGTVVTLSFDGLIGNRNIVGQAGGTAITLNPGSAYEMRLYNTTYFDAYKVGNLACAPADTIGNSFTVANLGGLSGTIKGGAGTNGSVNTGSNATCSDFATTSGTLSIDLSFVGNESRGYFTIPADLATPGYSDSFVAVLEIDSDSAAAYATNLVQTPTSLAGCTPRSMSGAAVTAGSTKLVWDCPGNVGSNSPGASSSWASTLTLQANTGYSPSENLAGSINGTLNFYLRPKDVFRNTLTGAYQTDFEDNAGTLTAAGQTWTQAISICT